AYLSPADVGRDGYRQASSGGHLRLDARHGRGCPAQAGRRQENGPDQVGAFARQGGHGEERGAAEDRGRSADLRGPRRRPVADVRARAQSSVGAAVHAAMSELPRSGSPSPAARIGIGGPVGSGKTALLERLIPALGARGVNLAVITNDLVTAED